ncbi:hypothetical protein PInf_018858 [Phytophthora infestans]|nr:hypothetical protein PInf_018858 [Phytophthora infestans]
MDKLVQLQAALRVIETGQRLESVDGVLVRQVLQQRQTQRRRSTREPDTKDLYRELLALRKSKANTTAKQRGQHVDVRDKSEAASLVTITSPPKKPTQTGVCRNVSVVKTRLESPPSLPGRDTTCDIDQVIAEELAACTTETFGLMQKALVTREKELRRSEKAVTRADAELREELARAEKILPSKFLFERNLASNRQLEAARSVLSRFQHRFFQLYFASCDCKLNVEQWRTSFAFTVDIKHDEKHDAYGIGNDANGESFNKASDRKNVFDLHYYELRRQCAATSISKAVCHWFGVEAKREAARVKQIKEWMALVQRELERSRCAAVLIQRHLRRWVEQRKFLMTQARHKKQARRTRLAEKSGRIERMQQRTSSARFVSDKKVLEAGNSPVRIIPSSSQPTRIMTLLKPMKLRESNSNTAHNTDAKAAVTIQCFYRRYRVRKRARCRKWRNDARKVENRVLTRHKAATDIQRRVRGIHGRNVARQRFAERLLQRYLLRWKRRRIQKRRRAARRIGRWLKHKRTQRLAKLWRVEKQTRLAASTRLQKWYRARCLLPSHLRRVLQVVRRREETLVFCDQSLRLCRQHLADGFVVQSFNVSLEDALRPLLFATASRSPTRPRASPTKPTIVASSGGKRHSSAVAFPILQMMFLMASGWKLPFVWRELDGKTLLQTKLERTKAVSFFRSLVKQGNPVAHRLQQSSTVETTPCPTRRKQKPGTKVAKGVETFASVEVDVAVARSTGGAKGALDFASFVRVIERLGEISLAQNAALYWGRFDGTEARILALSWYSLLSHSSLQPLALQFETLVSGELSRHASCLQGLFARRHYRLRGKIILLERRRHIRHQELARAAVVLQTQARKLLARRELRRLMQETYEKFLDPTWGLPYWMNPRSGYSTWQKPPILGAGDVHCEPVPFPPPERTLKAPCNGRKDCDRCAEWVCYDCNECFCLVCFGGYHKAKAIASVESIEAANDREDATTQSSIKRDHELERLLLCGLCRFQLASRRCLECIPKPKPKPPVNPNSASLGKPKQPSKEIKSAKSTCNDDEEQFGGESLFCDTVKTTRTQLHVRPVLSSESKELVMPSSGNVKRVGIPLVEFVGAVLFSPIQRKVVESFDRCLYKRWADSGGLIVFEKNKRLEIVQIWIKCVREFYELARSGVLERSRPFGALKLQFFGPGVLWLLDAKKPASSGCIVKRMLE